MADYQNRSITIEHGKKLYLNPRDMGASGAGGALSLTDGKVWYIGTTSQVLEPITQPRKTNTPRGPDFSDLANNILGTVKLYVIF